MKKRLIKAISVILLIIVMTQPVYAANINSSQTASITDKKLNIGYSTVPGFYYQDVNNGDGAVAGYIIDYIKQLWDEKNLVFGFSSSDAVLETELSEGKYDLIISRKDKLENLDNYIFTDSAIMKEHCVMYVDSNADIYYDDFDRFNGLNIGMIKGEMYENALANYAVRNSFTYNIVYYNSVEEIEAAMANGEIDSFILGSRFDLYGNYKQVTTFGLFRYYLAALVENEEIIEQINANMVALEERLPVYVADLFAEYYWDSVGIYPDITRADHEIAMKYQNIKVGYMSDLYPLECTNWEGDFSGIVKSLFDLCQSYTGLTFEYYAYSDAEQCYYDLANGIIDLIALAPYDIEWAQSQNILVSDMYLSIPMFSVTLNGKTNHDSVAMISYLNNTNFMQQYTENSEVNYYSNIRGCLDAVRSGSVEAAYVNKYSWMSYTNNTSYSYLDAIQIKGANIKYAVAAMDNAENKEIIALINKTIDIIPEKLQEKIIINEILTSYDKGNVFEQFFDMYRYQVVVVLVILSAIFLALFTNNRRKREEMIKELAYTDSVTGMANFAKFLSMAEDKLAYANNKYAIGFVNIDNFKYINDFYGREQGDKVLKIMSQLLEDLTMPNGIFARQAADRFVFMVEYIDYETLKYNIDIYISEVEMKISEFSDSIKIKCNCGIYIVENFEENIHDMIDKAALAEKSARDILDKSVVKYDSSINSVFVRNQILTAHMEKALANDEFQVYLQPKMDIMTERPASCEALVRWFSPTLGFVSPAEFIPLFERNGFVTEVDFYVLDRVCRYIRSRMDRKLPIYPVSINQSRMHVNNPMYFSYLQNVLNQYEIPMNYIMLEITETAFIEQTKDMIDLINKMKKLGFKFSIDDFGSGYSSFNLLKDLPIDELKIDREFLESTTGNDKNKYIIEKIVQMAHGLKAKVVCEGVETKEQLDFLNNIYCDEAQGYYYAKPMSMEEFDNFVAKYEQQA